MKRLYWLSLLLISILALAGCIPPAERIFHPTSEVQFPSPMTPPVSETLIPSVTATLTLAITDTATPTPTVRAPFVTHTLTATPTPVNTLAPEKVTATLQPLYHFPLNCDATPCFWGVIPEQTHFDDVRVQFGSLGFTPFEGTDQYTGRYFYTIEFASNNGLHSYVTFYISNNIIKNIKVSTGNSELKKVSPQEWIGYSPQTLIKQFGKPSRVAFGIGWGGYNPTIAMIMYFDSSNLIVYYSAINVVFDQPDSVRFCPLRIPFDSVRLWIGGDWSPYSSSILPPTDDGIIPLEKATTVTLDQFTQLMLGDPQQACFRLNGDAFPK
jgi:hypothetical protein